MPSVAEQLRSAREAFPLTVHQLADKTKIKTEHIRALEGGDYNAFSAPVYIRGFVRTCCRTLHLDETQVMADLDAELSTTDRFKAPPSLMQGSGGFLDRIFFQLSRMKWGVLLPLVVLVVVVGGGVLGYRAWREHQSRDPLANLGEGKYQPTSNSMGETLPVPGTVPPPR